MPLPVRRALLSVSDKTGLVELARSLAQRKIEIVSTGGTARALTKGRRTVWIPWALGPASVAMRLLPQFVWRRMPR